MAELIEPVFSHFCAFAKAQIASGDLDPTYPVLKRLYADEGLPPEIALWRTFLYVTFYNLHSAEVAWSRYPKPQFIEDPLTLPTGIERRGFRGNDKARHHINALFYVIAKKGLPGWISAFIDWAPDGKPTDAKHKWAVVRQVFQMLPGGGEWSSYKWADLLKNVHGYPITANNIGVGGASKTAGPVCGMVRITGASWKQCAADVVLQQEVHDEAVKRGVPFNGLDQFETACCDFNSLSKGAYYVGHDIDTQQEHVAQCSEAMKRARLASFPRQYLGEFGGWTGVRKELKTLYKDTGQISVLPEAA